MLRQVWRKACATAGPTLRTYSRQNWTSSWTVGNSGSIARDVLAAERTFLAWARTGLSFLGAGTALFTAYHGHPRIEQRDVAPACGLLVGNGSFLLLFATRRYLMVVRSLRKGEFPIGTPGTLAAVSVTAASTMASLGLLVQAEFESDDSKLSVEQPSKEAPK